MAFSLISNVGAGSAIGNDITTAAIDTTGASLLVVCVNDYTVNASTLSDSKGNTWTGLTAKMSTTAESKLYYCKNPTVGTGHTFTAAGTSIYATINVAAFSGAHLTAPFDQQNGATTAGATSLATGSITPSENNELIIAGISNVSAARSIDAGFTIANQVNYAAGFHYGGAIAYLIQTTAGAVNPSWSWTGSGEAAAVIASFKVPAAGGGGFQSGWGQNSNVVIQPGGAIA